MRAGILAVIFLSFLLILAGYNIVPRSLVLPLIFVILGVYLIVLSFSSDYKRKWLFSEREYTFFWGSLVTSIGILWVLTFYIFIPSLTLAGILLLVLALAYWVIRRK